MAMALRPRPSAATISSRSGSHALTCGARPDRCAETGAASVPLPAAVAGEESVDTSGEMAGSAGRAGGRGRWTRRRRSAARCDRRRRSTDAPGSTAGLCSAISVPNLSDSRPNALCQTETAASSLRQPNDSSRLAARADGADRRALRRPPHLAGQPAWLARTDTDTTIATICTGRTHPMQAIMAQARSSSAGMSMRVTPAGRRRARPARAHPAAMESRRPGLASRPQNTGSDNVNGHDSRRDSRLRPSARRLAKEAATRAGRLRRSARRHRPQPGPAAVRKEAS